MAVEERSITGPQMNGTNHASNLTVYPDRDPNDNRGIRIPRRGVVMVESEVPIAPDINNPEDGNKIVSPDNLHTNLPLEVAEPEAPMRDAKGHFAKK